MVMKNKLANLWEFTYVLTFREFGSIYKDVKWTHTVRSWQEEKWKLGITSGGKKKKKGRYENPNHIKRNTWKILEGKPRWYTPFKAALGYNCKAANESQILFSFSSVYKEVNGAASNLHEADKRCIAFEFHLDFIKHTEIQKYSSVIQLDLRKPIINYVST